jgi:hypothetical protein
MNEWINSLLGELGAPAALASRLFVSVPANHARRCQRMGAANRDQTLVPWFKSAIL